MLTLNMIVKNEAQVIERCLASVKPFIDRWVILDTGSTDGTQKIIQEYLKDIPGSLHSSEFIDFSSSRNQALDLARMFVGAGYVLTIDADEVLVCDPDFSPSKFAESLTHDMYDVVVRYGNLKYHRSLIYSLVKPFVYRGVVHEFLDCPGDISRSLAKGFHLMPRPDGARSADPGKFLKDAKAIEHALLTETDPLLVNRYKFYRGQCYRDAGQLEQAYAAFIERAESGGWAEEKAMAMLNAANCLLGYRGADSLDKAVTLLFNAYLTAPHRAEPLYLAARVCRMNIRFDQAYRISKEGLRISMPDRGLFVLPDIYRWGMAEEYGLACYWTERFAEAVYVFSSLLKREDIPKEHRDRLQNSLQLSEKAMHGSSRILKEST
jgi:glycosyltransferase involved in cell wall biosynthesis